MDIMETWPDPTEYLFQSIEITETPTFREHLHPSSPEFGWRAIEISARGAVIGHLWVVIIYFLLKKKQPKRWRFCEGSLKEGGSNGGHKYSSDIFQKHSCTQRNRYFPPVLQHINTRQTCGKPKSLRSLSWKRKRHNDLEATSAALAAAAGGESPAPTASWRRGLQQFLTKRKKPEGT